MEKVRYMISDASSMVNVESRVLRYWEDEFGVKHSAKRNGTPLLYTGKYQRISIYQRIKREGLSAQSHKNDRTRMAKYMEQRLPELTGNEADKPGGVKNHQVYFKNPETLALAEAKQSILDNTDRMAQFTELMTDIVGKAISEQTMKI